MKSILWVFLLLSHRSNAEWEPIKNAPLVVEKLSYNEMVHKDGSSSLIRKTIYRIQNEAAKDAFSEDSIEFNSHSQKVKILAAYTINGEERTNVNIDAIVERHIVEANGFDAVKKMIITFPKVKVGSRLHLKYKIDTFKPLIAGRWSRKIVLVPGLSVENWSHTLDSELPIFVDTNDPTGLVSVSKIGRSRVAIVNKKAIPGGVVNETDPVFLRSRAAIVRITTTKEWGNYFAPLKEAYSKALLEPIPNVFDDWLDGLRSSKSIEDKILYLAVEIGKHYSLKNGLKKIEGGVKPRNLSQIGVSRVVDSKDMALLWAALFRKLNLDAQPALVAWSSEYWGSSADFKWPVADDFDHMVVRVNSANGVYWIDPANPMATLKPFLNIRGRQALVLGNQKVYLDRIPDIAASDFQEIYNYEYDFGTTRRATVKFDVQMKNLSPAEFALNLSELSKASMQSLLIEVFSNKDEITSYRFLKDHRQERVLKDFAVVAEYVTGQLTFKAGKYDLFPLSNRFWAKVLFEDAARESDVRLASTPMIRHWVHRLKNVQIVHGSPAPCKIDVDWVSMLFRVEEKGSDVFIFEYVELRNPLISNAIFRSPEFRKTVSQIKQCFLGRALLIKPFQSKRE